ncbi:MAG: thioredoxin domain-containing protein [Bacteroidota bacterium]
MAHKHSNHLINETSPYLLQHAHNPVNWYPWGKEALEKAKQEDKMILVSIGYSACHWCHVMERESFENEDTAAVMNRHFINIKIDREERPDLDHIYMDAVQAISGSGGWPLNVFLTPEAKPFYGGTYFPPVRAFNRSSWRELLQSLVQSWKEKRNEIEAQADNLTAHISKAGNFSIAGKKAFDISFENEFDNNTGGNIFSAIMKSADTVWGGFGRAPKFPQTFTIQYLFEFYHCSQNEEALKQALLSVDKMLEGGIYDHIGGGLARYSTDEQWLAPHFEKMLYDNALLIMILCDAFQITRNEKYRNAIHKTISFLQNELLHPLGGFYAALDADSEGEEGKFYVWSKKEVVAILGDDADIFCSFFDITEIGNWEGKNILRILKDEDQFIKEKGLDKSTFSKYKEDCFLKLLAERNKRTRPGLDDKIILGWNALAIKALAKAAIVLHHSQYRQLAINAYDFLIDNFNNGAEGCEMNHTWKSGISKYPAFLDDYAYLADASIVLYELTYNINYLTRAKSICNYVLQHFSDDENLFFYFTHGKQDDIIVRKKEIYDGATPSGNAVMAYNLHKLAIIYDEGEWRSRSGAMVQAISEAIIKYPTSFAMWASLLLQKISGSLEVAVLGKGALLTSPVLKADNYLPTAIIMASEAGDDEFPILRNKKTEDFVQIFVCRNYICYLPFTTAEAFTKEIRKLLKQ